MPVFPRPKGGEILIQCISTEDRQQTSFEKGRTAMQEKDLEKMDQAARDYFDSLPAALQEQLMQCGVTMTTKEQLETYCTNTLKKSGQL